MMMFLSKFAFVDGYASVSSIAVSEPGGLNHTSLLRDITHFIRHLGVTHYVSAIELGGLNFRVLTEKEYERKISLSGSASLNSKLYGAIEATSSKTNIWKFKSKREERKMIGKITRNEEREVVNEEDEAVIGCHIRPISSLVKNPYLQKAINESVRTYTQETISGKLSHRSMVLMSVAEPHEKIVTRARFYTGVYKT